MVEPIYVVPAVRAKLYDGSNPEEIAAWTGYELVVASETYVRVRVADDEVLQINHGSWVLASITDPPTFAGTIPDWEMRLWNVVHPGPVTPVPPIGSTPAGPEPEPEGEPA